MKNLLSRARDAAVDLLAEAGIRLPEAASFGGANEKDPCSRLNRGEVAFPTYDAGRVIFATAPDYGDSQVLITCCVKRGGSYLTEWQTKGFAGQNGFAPPGKMWEDTLYSPTGSFSITEALGRSNPGTALPYRELNPASRWGGEHGPKYNQYFEGRGAEADENLWELMQAGNYEQVAVINWNRPPDMKTVKGASYAIFFHVDNEPTWGCIGTDLGTVTRMLRNAVPGDRIVMGTVGDVFLR